jgi:hypothetical protein
MISLTPRLLSQQVNQTIQNLALPLLQPWYIFTRDSVKQNTPSAWQAPEWDNHRRKRRQR